MKAQVKLNGEGTPEAITGKFSFHNTVISSEKDGN
jgi:hypothetical protein